MTGTSFRWASASLLTFLMGWGGSFPLVHGIRGMRWGFDEEPTKPTRAPPEAHVACGTLKGSWEKDLAAFRGIPYGEAPVGNRRWKPAEPATCWSSDTALDVSKNGPICFQGKGGPSRFHAFEKFLGLAGDEVESEDCLNLNVFAPDGARDLPVFVWIYGGSSVEGHVGWDFYGPLENIVHRHPCIVVAMNYRLGVLGYLALKELSAVDPRKGSGNAGIADQQLALRWVQENIHAFGGDPKRVTLIGQSSGGTSILGHLASHSSRGLFHGAISLSASPNITMDRATKEAQDLALIIPRTPCASVSSSELLECLYTADAAALDAALPTSYSEPSSDAPNGEWVFDYPTNREGLKSRMNALLFVDGATITMPVLEALRTGLNDVPLLLQSTQAELDSPSKTVLWDVQSHADLAEFLHEKFDRVYGREVAERIRRFYDHYDPPQYGLFALDSDTGLACALRRFAMAARSGFRQPVYWTTVTSKPSSTVAFMWELPFHNWDFMAAVGNWDTFGYTPSEGDVAFGERILDDWFQLLTRGNLTSDRGYVPVQASPSENVIGSIVGDAETRAQPDHKHEVCTFWESIGVDQRWWWIN
ncbi:ACHE [Symbiodinium natans]|uniref:Carboxylic ester hydrolase n=1 Tax=Symbiodinium natans TaxID=878477 RepID=A0A812LG30_9DINO|nr:ACHE [Symbiodinium natans]